MFTLGLQFINRRHSSPTKNWVINGIGKILDLGPYLQSLRRQMLNSTITNHHSDECFEASCNQYGTIEAIWYRLKHTGTPWLTVDHLKIPSNHVIRCPTFMMRKNVWETKLIQMYAIVSAVLWSVPLGRVMSLIYSNARRR